jgi:methylated-DNA-[protein]-cysteine S-methyltransferase
MPKIRQNNFAHQVREAVRRIPKGETRTYGEIAKDVGHSGAARAVGTIMKGNYDPAVPCHRVIRSDGTIGAYNRGGPAKKRAILKAEGVPGM